MSDPGKHKLILTQILRKREEWFIHGAIRKKSEGWSRSNATKYSLWKKIKSNMLYTCLKSVSYPSGSWFDCCISATFSDFGEVQHMISYCLMS